jgi:cellulose synthase/poly-beta-1,6-N-acetylglucosamine synthase-like glycosyltransferase
MYLPSIFYDAFRFAFAGIFVGLHCVLMAGLSLEWRRDRRAIRRGLGPEGLGSGKKPASDGTADLRATAELVSTAAAGEAEDLPLVSVIIPIRNESLRMEGLLGSLGLQDYPRAEYIFIDDRSSDESLDMLRRFAEVYRNVRIIVLEENPGPNHKQYALCKGLEAAQGKLILLTDADCEVPPTWIRAMVFRMADKRTGVTIGPVFKKSGGKGFFYRDQCFDHAIRYMYRAASTGLGAAGGGFGNNLIIRRDALDAIGGYDAVPPSPTEDAALISRIRSASPYRVRSACGGDVQVLTGSEKSWKDLVNQTLRWNNGGLFSPDPVTRFSFGFLMITISMGILAIPITPFIPSLWPLPASVLLSMTMNAAATLKLFGAVLPKGGPAYIIQTVFTPIYFTFLTILGFCRIKVNWKDNPLP